MIEKYFCKLIEKILKKYTQPNLCVCRVHNSASVADSRLGIDCFYAMFILGILHNTVFRSYCIDNFTYSLSSVS